MEQRNIVAFNFVRRQSETSLMPNKSADHNANVLKSPPPPSRVGRSMTFTPRDFARPASAVTARVTLPERFSRKIRHKKSDPCVTGSGGGVMGGSGVGSGASLTNIEESEEERGVGWEDRKLDMERAIGWIRQELLRLREQDRVLVARFLDLHAAVQHAHGIRSCPSLVRSSSSLSASSWLSLDDGSLSAPCDTPLHQRDAMLDLQQRTRENQRRGMTHSSSVGDGMIASLSDSDLQGRVISLSDIRIGNVKQFEKFKNGLTLTRSDSFEGDSGSEYNNDTLTRERPYSSESESESDYNDDTLTRKPKKKHSNVITCELEQDYDELFNSEYTDTLTKPPAFLASKFEEMNK